MFCVLYVFQVKPGSEQAFEASWHEMTAGIYRTRGSLGSRLHKAASGEYIAYAQWPSEEQYKQDSPDAPTLKPIGVRMRESCESIATLHTMTVVDDMLMPPPNGETT